MSTMNDLAKRIRRSNKAYFAAGMEAGKQKVVDLFFVAAHELGMLKGWIRVLRSSAVRSFSRFSNGTIQLRIGGTNEDYVGAERRRNGNPE